MFPRPRNASTSASTAASNAANVSSRPFFSAARSSGSVNCASGMVGVWIGIPPTQGIGRSLLAQYPRTANPHFHVVHPTPVNARGRLDTSAAGVVPSRQAASPGRLPREDPDTLRSAEQHGAVDLRLRPSAGGATTFAAIAADRRRPATCLHRLGGSPADPQFCARCAQRGGVLRQRSRAAVPWPSADNSDAGGRQGVAGCTTMKVRRRRQRCRICRASWGCGLRNGLRRNRRRGNLPGVYR